MGKNHIYELDDLYRLAQEKNIIISDFKFQSNRKAIALAEDTSQYIGMDYKKINSYAEEKSILAEEITHHEIGILPSNFSSNSRIDVITRCQNENKCRRKSILKLVNKNELIKDLKSGEYDLSYGYNIYDLAQKHQVTEEDINNAINIYLVEAT